MTSAFIAVTVLVALYCLWVRRDTWWSRWEICVTVALGLQACTLALMSPWAAELCGPLVHRVLPMWNIQQLVGQICFVVAIAAITYHVLLRVAPVERAGPWFRRLVVRPVAVGVVTMVALFVVADAEYRPDGFSAVNGDLDTWQLAYWLTLSGVLFYLSAVVMRLMLIARSDQRARETVALYTGSMIFGLSSLLVQLSNIWIDGDVSTLAWLFVCLSVVIFSVGSARSWQAKAAWFTAQKNELTQSPPPQTLS